MPGEDARRIGRWTAIRRPLRHIQRNCKPSDIFRRRRQRPALLHWADDTRKI